MINTLLYNWTNGVVMISIFAVVCVILVGMLINFMTSEKKKEEQSEN